MTESVRHKHLKMRKSKLPGMVLAWASPRADAESAVRSLFGKEREEGQGNEHWDRDRRQGIKSIIKTATTGPTGEALEQCGTHTTAILLTGQWV